MHPFNEFCLLEDCQQPYPALKNNADHLESFALWCQVEKPGEQHLEENAKTKALDKRSSPCLPCINPLRQKE